MKANPQPNRQPPLGFHVRLETHVAVAVTLVIAFALGAALFIVTGVITEGSLERASNDLAAARSAFERLADDRAQSAAAEVALVTRLPVFSASMADPRQTGAKAPMQIIAEEYRLQLKGEFCLVTDRHGNWTGSSGWPRRMQPPTWISRMIRTAAEGQPARDIAEVGDRLFLAVSEPARFADESLGTLTVGYTLDDAVARQLADVTHCDVNIAVGGHLSASSLRGDERAALASLIATDQSLAARAAPRIERLAGHEYVTGAFALSPKQQSTNTGLLVLLQDWAPTQRYLNQLQRQLLGAGVAVFFVALAGGLFFAHRVSRPLKDMASAASDIAAGNWDRQMRVRGSAEAAVMARAFNEMTTSLRHWYQEVKKRDDALRQAQKMEAIGRLAGGVAHDFNNLLTAIRGYGELVMHQLEPQDPRREEVSEILAAADRAAELTKQLLAFSRPQVVATRVFALHEVVASTEPMLRRLISEDINLVTTIEPNAGRVRADRGQMVQVLLNLVVNARDAMPNGGTLRIDLAKADPAAAPGYGSEPPRPGRYLCLSVGDTGHGMDRETAARVFEPFFTTKEEGIGSGLGLSIVYRIVQQEGGIIDVDTEVGRGTTVRVYLPQTTDEEDRAPPDPGAVRRPEPPRKTATVLLVEDDERLAALISLTLREAGYTVLQATHGQQALELARAHPATIHLLLADVVLPGLNGRELSERLVATRPETRVLFMSGYSDEAVLQRGIETTTAPFIQKPFTMEALTAKVKEMLRSPFASA